MFLLCLLMPESDALSKALSVQNYGFPGEENWNGPFRGVRGTLWEGAVRVPAFIHRDPASVNIIILTLSTRAYPILSVGWMLPHGLHCQSTYCSLQ